MEDERGCSRLNSFVESRSDSADGCSAQLSSDRYVRFFSYQIFRAIKYLHSAGTPARTREYPVSTL